ncbi:MAG: hypothetical protein H6623_03065 [Bdellovibrionaceae bacterium]|nr:hypothetical protein [Pseudobdellovibrionaceae bacterium]
MVSKRDKYIYSGAVVIIVALAMLFIRAQKNESGAGAKAVTFQALDLERKRAISHKQMEQKKMEVTNWKTAPKLDNNLRPIHNNLEDPASKIQLESAKNHAEVDARDPDVYEIPMSSLETQINKRMVNEQYAAQMSALQKKNFVEGYKKRALAMGYMVELNDKLELIRATKVRTIQQNSPSVEVDSMEEDYDEGDE